MSKKPSALSSFLIYLKQTDTVTKTLFILSGALLICGFIVDYQFPRTSVHKINNYGSSAFRSHRIADPAAAPKSADILEVSVPLYGFQNPAPAFSKAVKITFRYKCEPHCQQLWITLTRDPSLVSPRVLITHQLFDNLNWFHVGNENFSLFQKNISYPSIAAFMSNPPVTEVITEETIQQLYNLPTSKIQFIEQIEEIPQGEYVFTTYQPSRQPGEWTTFTRPFSLQGVQRNEDNHLLWQIETVSSEENQKVWITKPQFEFR